MSTEPDLTPADSPAIALSDGGDDARAEADAHRTLVAVTTSIGICAALFAVGAGFSIGLRFALAVAVGGAIAVANFMVLARIGKAVTGSAGAAGFWGAIYFIKLALLFGGLFVLFQTRVVDPIGIVVGLAALGPGIVVGGLVAPPGGSSPTRTAPRKTGR